MTTKLIWLGVLLFRILDAKAQWWGQSYKVLNSVATAGYSTSISPLDNSIYVSGVFSQNANSGGYNSGYLVKFDSIGILQWEKIFYTSHSIKVLNKVDQNGNVILSGKFIGSVDFGNHIFQTSGTFLIKYDSNGNELIALHDTSAYVNYMDVDAQGNIYLAGNKNSTHSNLVFGKPLNKDYFMAKFDEYGNNLWVKYFFCPATSNYDFDFCVDQVGNIYSAGTFNQFGIRDITDSLQLNCSGDNDAFVAKYNSQLDLIWVKTIFGMGTEIGSRISVNNAGDIFVGGYVAAPPSSIIHNFDSIQINGKPNSMSDIFLTKFNSSGSCQWAKIVGGNGSDYLKGIYADSNESFFITGFIGMFGDSASFEDKMVYFPHDQRQTFLAQYNSAGELGFVEATNTGQSHGQDIAGNGHGMVCLTGGKTQDITLGPVSLSGSYDMFLVVRNEGQIVSGVPHLNTKAAFDINVYPNPSGSVFNLICNSKIINSSAILIRVTNESGKLVLAQRVTSSKLEVSTTIDLSKEPGGIYFIEVICGDVRRVKKVVKQ
jgi:hypothetical protein